MISGKYVLEEFKLDGIIPLLTVKSVDSKKKALPTVIVVHGLASAKERNLAFAMQLANSGFLVVLPDVYNHGDRGSSTFLTDLFSNPVNTIFDAVTNTVDDIIRLIDYLCQERDDSDCEKIGITGISLGGIITFITGINERRIKVLVPILASGDLLTIAQESSLTQEIHSVNKLDMKELSIPLGLQNVLSQLDPVMNPTKYFPRPLLMINGEKDTVFPTKAVRKTIEVLKKAYTRNPSLFRYRIFPGVGHEVTASMINAAIDFLKKYLKNNE